MMELDLVFNNWHPTTSSRSTCSADCGHGPQQIHQLWAPDAASDRPSPHVTSPAMEDHYDRWSPKSCIKWTQWTL